MSQKYTINEANKKIKELVVLLNALFMEMDQILEPLGSLILQH